MVTQPSRGTFSRRCKNLIFTRSDLSLSFSLCLSAIDRWSERRERRYWRNEGKKQKVDLSLSLSTLGSTFLSNIERFDSIVGFLKRARSGKKTFFSTVSFAFHARLLHHRGQRVSSQLRRFPQLENARKWGKSEVTSGW